MEWFASTILALGIGLCDGAGDWCREPVGYIAMDQSIVETRKHSIWGSVKHYSELGNGEPFRGDYGVNTFILEYRYKLR